MDFVLKAEFPSGRCKYLRMQGFNWTDEFERATRFECMEDAQAAQARAEALGWTINGQPIDATYSVVCC